jgi:four helix bundle protein
MKDFRRLKVWDKAHQLTLAIYKVTKKFPKEEMYGLASQMRRSSASIATNIAEGCGRNSDADFCRFLVVASGSGSELEYQLLLCRDLGYLDEKEHDALLAQLTEVKKMLNGLIHKLSSRKANS